MCKYPTGLPDICFIVLGKRYPPALEKGPRELTFKGPIDMGGSKRCLEEGASGDDGHSLVNLVNDRHQAGLFLDLDLRRQERSPPARALCPSTPGTRSLCMAISPVPPQCSGHQSHADHSGQALTFLPIKIFFLCFYLFFNS